MKFCEIDNSYIKESFTLIDNIFLQKYLPSGDGIDIKVYLYGLSLATINKEEENSLEKMAIALKLSEERIISAYRYWEEKGLITLSKNLPLTISYNSIKNPVSPTVKYNVRKYETFVEEVSRLFPEKILSPNEIGEFIELIHTGKMEINAMLLIIKYCLETKKGTASTPYILAVANDWINQGITTEQKVNEHIENLEANSESIRMILKSIGITRQANLDDRQYYIKWTKEYKYNLDAILIAAKAQKRRGGIERLDRYIEELKNANAFSSEEIASYTKNKEKIYDLAINTTKNLGCYYASMDIVIETYIIPWISLGFSHNALLLIAKFCFIKNVKNLESMKQMVNRFFKLGLLEENSINSYIEKQIEIDKKIENIFSNCGHIGIISNRDREFYHTWIEWGYDDEIILFVSSNINEKAFPMQAINRKMAMLNQKNIKTLEEAKKILAQKTISPKIEEKDKEFEYHQYSEKQLKQVLADFETWEL